MIQSYLIINQTNNVVENVVVWDGNTDAWSPPPNTLAIPSSTTPTLVWKLNEDKTDWVLQQEMGFATVGYTWNGTECVTNEPKPSLPILSK